MGRYVKNLKSMGAVGETLTTEQVKEVDRFRKFLLANPSILDRKFSNPQLKAKDIIYMDCVEQFLSGDDLEKFWAKMGDVERIFFPDGRPVVAQGGADGGLSMNEAMANATALIESDEAKKLVGDDPLLAEVMKQVVSSGALTSGGEGPADISAIMQNPRFMELAANITGSLTSGKYTKDSLEKTVDTLTGLVGDDIDPELKKMMSFLKKAVKDIKAGRPADLGTLFELVGSISGGEGGFDIASMMQMMMQQQSHSPSDK